LRHIDGKAALGFALLALWLLVALLGPALTPNDPNAQDLSEALKPFAWSADGTWRHPLGTDQLGRDILSRVVYGARSSLWIGLLAVAGSALIGTLIGIAAAQGGGWADEILMRLADIQLSIPFFLLAVAVLAIVGGAVQNLILILIIAGWVPYARVVRSELLYVRETEFLLAAKSIGAGRLRIMFNYLLPSTRSLVIVTATLQLADVVLLSAALSFLGVGLQPPAVSWGTMLADGRDYISTEWWIATVPGIAITLAILSVNLAGDWLSDIMNPRLGKKELL
jgi:peptide/nickel transport system permease protein